MNQQATQDSLQPTLGSSANDPVLLWGVCIFLALAVGYIYAQTSKHEFVNYDDPVYVTENPMVLHGLGPSQIKWAFTPTGYAANWHPLTWMSHMLDVNLYGLDAGKHHWTSVAMHAATAILLFLALLRLTGHAWPSALAAALFAVHPLRVESVAWIAERKDVLSGLFFMLTLMAYASYAQRTSDRRRYFLVAVMFALGLMSKPMLVTVPCVLLLLDYWPLNRMAFSSRFLPSSNSTPGGDIAPRSFLDLVVEKFPLFTMVAISCWITMRVQQMAIVGQLPLECRLGNAVVSYVAYLKQFVYPASLACIYTHPGMPPTWKIIGAAAVLLVLSAFAWLTRRRHPYFLVGWLWYLGMMVPVIGLVQVGDQAMADRYTYLPQIGLCIAVAWGVEHLFGSLLLRREVFVGACVIVLIVLMVAARQQTAYWRDSLALWTHAQSISPKSSTPANHIGMYYAEKKQWDDAISAFHKAVAINPRNDNAYNSLGLALMSSNRVDEAIVEYRKALKINPAYPEANLNLGIGLMSMNRLDEAAGYFRRAIRSRPTYTKAFVFLGMVQTKRGYFDEAIESLKVAVALQPNNSDIKRLLDEAQSGRAKVLDDLSGRREAIQEHPKGNLVELNEMAWTLATNPNASVRNGAEAVKFAEQAVRLPGGRHPKVLATLAAAYAEAKRFPDAVRTAQEALDLAIARNDVALAETIRARLKLYKADKPYHSP